MKRLVTICVVAAVLGANLASARGDKVFETGTPGPPTDGGTALSDINYVGVRFDISGGPQTIASVGGHFDGVVVAGPRTIFAAIVKLVAPNNFPASTDFASLPAGDLLATALITLDAKVPGGNPTSRIYEAPLQAGPITLDPGTYGLVFGGGLFGANAGTAGAATTNNTAIGASFFGVDVDDDLFIQNPGTGFYFFATPEPSGVTLASMALLGLVMIRRRRRS